MKALFEKMIINLIQINDNVYSFVGGIFISLATNIFTTLCFEEFNLKQQWNQYMSTIFFVIASGICLYLSTKVSTIQQFVQARKISGILKKREVIADIIQNKIQKWLLIYIMLLSSIICGAVFLVLNFVR